MHGFQVRYWSYRTFLLNSINEQLTPQSRIHNGIMNKRLRSTNVTNKWHFDHRSTFCNRHIGITFCTYYIFSCLSVWQKFFLVAPFNSYFFFSASYTFCSFSRNSKSAYGVQVNYLFWHHTFCGRNWKIIFTFLHKIRNLIFSKICEQIRTDGTEKKVLCKRLCE